MLRPRTDLGLAGASILAAGGALPLHLLPVVVAALIVGGFATVEQAAVVAATAMIGQLAASIALPVLRLRALRYGHVAVVSILLIAALLASAELRYPSLLLCWFCIGGACGAFAYVGTTTAARHPDRTYAFSVRLSVSLVSAGLVTACIVLLGGVDSYRSFAFGLAVLFALIIVAGLTLYGATETVREGQPAIRAGSAGCMPLLVVFVLFAGQVGFWTFAVHTAINKGLPGRDVALALATCKVVAGGALGLWAYRQSRFMKGYLLIPGLIVLGSINVLGYASSLAALTVGFLAWELGFNVLSARLQARVIVTTSSPVGLWLTASVLLGAAVGPLMQGILLSTSAAAAFYVFASLSALVPAVWDGLEHRRSSEQQP